MTNNKPYGKMIIQDRKGSGLNERIFKKAAYSRIFFSTADDCAWRCADWMADGSNGDYMPYTWGNT